MRLPLVQIGSEMIDVRELSVDDWRELEAETRPMLEDLHIFLKDAHQHERAISTEEYRRAAFGTGELGRILDAHADVLALLIAKSCGRDPAWVKTHRLDASARLRIAWLGVNCDRLARFAAAARPTADLQ